MKTRAIFTIISCIMLCGNAYGKLSPLKKTKVFEDWVLYEGTSHNKKACYASVTPYRTRSFVGIRGKPWIAVSFVDYDKFTVSAYSGFDIDNSAGFQIESDKGEAINLKVLADGQIWSYSNKQDIHLINSLLQGDMYFTVRSYSVDNQTALDYYSLKGFNKIINYMNKSCINSKKI